jgi:hypothetical protein
MPALLPIILTASNIVLAADAVPKFNIELTCRAAAEASGPDRGVRTCQRDEDEARVKLEQDWTKYTAVQRTGCVRFAGLGSTPSYVELLTCLEMAKEVETLPKDPLTGSGRP